MGHIEKSAPFTVLISVYADRKICRIWPNMPLRIQDPLLSAYGPGIDIPKSGRL